MGGRGRENENREEWVNSSNSDVNIRKITLKNLNQCIYNENLKTVYS